MPKNVEIKLVGIFNQKTGSDLGNELEIYGALGAKLMSADGSVIFQSEMWKELDNPVDIAEGSLYSINRNWYVEMNPGNALRIYGHLWEDDSPLEDDDMGGDEKYIDYDSISQTPLFMDLAFQEDTQKVQAQYRVTEQP